MGDYRDFRLSQPAKKLFCAAVRHPVQNTLGSTGLDLRQRIINYDPVLVVKQDYSQLDLPENLDDFSTIYANPVLCLVQETWVLQIVELSEKL